MKKSIIIILTILMMLSLNIVSFAAYLGDVNDDGKITASDARTILRVSAKLEQLDDKKMVFADVNTDGRITASDARTVLRMSARLEPLQEFTTKAPETHVTTTEPSTNKPVTEESTTEEPTTEEPTTEEPTAEEPTTEEPTTQEPTTQEPTTEEPTTEPKEEVTYPEGVKAFLSGKYYISGRTPDKRQLKIAVSGDDTELAILSGKAQLSLLKKTEKTYIKVITAEAEKYYVRYNELMKELFGSDFEALTSRFNFAAYSETEAPVVNSGTADGTPCDIYSFENDGSILNFYVADGKVFKIENITSEGDVSGSFAVAEMSGKIPADMLKVKGFTATGIAYIPYLVPEFLGTSSAEKPAVKTYPAAVEIFLNGKYHMSGTLYDGEEHSFTYTFDGSDKAVSVDGISYFSRRGIRYIRNNEFFAQVNDTLLTEYGIDFDKVLVDNTFTLSGKTECIAFEKSTYDSLPCDIYTLRDANGKVMKFTVVFERLARIAVIDADGNEVKYLVLDEFDDDIPEGILTLVGYRRADLSKILG